MSSELPPYGLTLLAPWWACILWAGKNVENRSKSVASAVGEYRGRVLLTASKAHIGRSGKRRNWLTASGQVHPDIADDIRDKYREIGELAACWHPDAPTQNLRFLADHAGCVVGTARIAGIYKPWRTNKRWHSAGQYGILLEDPRYWGKPEPATGGLGFWRVKRCDQCARIVAHGSRHTCVGGESCLAWMSGES
jgi:hypothetical protein